MEVDGLRVGLVCKDSVLECGADAIQECLGMWSTLESAGAVGVASI